MGKIRIDGFKRSIELVQLRFFNVPEPGALDIRIYKHLTARRINIHFLSRVLFDKNVFTSCCISPEFQKEIETIVEFESGLKKHVLFIPSVGLISIFPHRFSLTLVGRSLSALKKNHIPIYGMASSISSITFVTDYGKLDKAEEALRDVFDLSA